MHEQKKTRTKTFRFDVSLIEKLKRSAERAGVSESELVSEVLWDRLLIDPLIPAFQIMQLSSGVVQSILGASNADALEAAASDVAKKNFPLIRELYKVGGTTLEFREFVTEIMGRHGGWFYVEGSNGTHQ